ncbi:phage/plasmid primase, P4 family [Roseomonas mucosa]
MKSRPSEIPTAPEADGDAVFTALPSPLDRPVTLSLFTDRGASQKKEVERTFRTLAPSILKRTAAEKAKLPWLKLARFGDSQTAKGSFRHDANVLSIDGIEADYDGEAVSLDEACALLRAADLAAMVYTSPSHTPDKPRWRVLCPTSVSLPPDERARLVARVNGALGGILAGESFTLSQSYYYGSVASNPAHRVELVEGRAVDEALNLDSQAIGRDGPARDSTRATPATVPPGKLDVAKLKEEIVSGASYHEASIRLLGKWARSGVPLMDARARLRRLFDRVPEAQRDTRWKDRRRDIDRVLEGIYGKEAAKKDKASASALEGFDLTEDGIALAFEAQFRGRLRFDHHSECWYEWNGVAWRRDEVKRAADWVRDVCREHAKGEDVSDRDRRILARAGTAAGVEKFARNAQGIAVTSAIWDRDPWLLGTPAGTVDLRTGQLRASDPAEGITRLTSVAPAGSFDPEVDCPTWMAFLRQVTREDAGLMRFLQQWCGYLLTGETREHALLFLYGPGGNGKSVFLLDTVAGVLGEYARNAAMDTFTASKYSQHPTDLALLRGARLVTASETEEGHAWAESRIKQMTGGDPITARFMRQDFFTYQPEFKLTILGNHKPVLRNVDAAMKRRFNMVNFFFKPGAADGTLKEKLKAEWPEILSWMIAGCLDWQANGLVRPQVVLDATAEYFETQDTFQQWLDERCEVGRAFSAASSDLWDSWEAFAEGRGEKVGGKTKSFPDALRGRGFEPVRAVRRADGTRGNGFSGLRLRDVEGYSSTAGEDEV